MKLKLTLLLILALQAVSTHAASPKLPAAQSAKMPSMRPNANVILPNVIKPVLPKVPAASSNRSSSSGFRLPAPASRGNIRPAVPVLPGLKLPNAAGLHAGREIAEGLKAMESLRNLETGGLPAGLRDPFAKGITHTPRGIADPWGQPKGSAMREPKAPDHVSGRKIGLKDIRGGLSNSRRGNATTGLSATGDRVLQSEVSMASGRSGTHTPVESTTHENGDVTASTTTTSPNGTTTSVEVTEFSDGSGTSTTTQSNDGRTDTLIVTRRDATGAVIWSRTDSVHEGGKQHIVVRDGSGRVTSDTTEYYSPGSRTIDRSPLEGGSLGGPVNGSGPSVGQVASLVPLDLLRQFANGESSSGTSNYSLSGGMSANHVCPVGAESQTGIGGNQNPVPVDRGGLVVLPAPGSGGSTPEGTP